MRDLAIRLEQRPEVLADREVLVQRQWSKKRVDHAS
jgi:hypothetical protein